MAPQDDLTAERAAIYKYHKVFDGYNFLSGPEGMEEIVGCDMELVSLDDHLEALKTTRQDALREARRAISTLFGENTSDTPEYYCALLDAGNALDRLASEGA